jgi:hypothetical protein
MAAFARVAPECGEHETRVITVGHGRVPALKRPTARTHRAAASLIGPRLFAPKLFVE